MKFMEKAKRFFTLSAKHEGFTLVELIVVIAILAILAGVAVPAYSGYIKRAEKAGDLQLLAAVNDAYAAACMAEGVDIKELTASNATIKIEKGLITEVYPAEIRKSFALFYDGNENTAFKVIEKLLFVKDDGVFVDAKDAPTTTVTLFGNSFGIKQPSVEAFNNSIFADNYTGMQTQVNGLAEAFGSVVGDFDTAATLDAGFAQYLKDNNIPDSDIGNAAVLYIAGQAANKTASDVSALFTKMEDGNPQNMTEMLQLIGDDGDALTNAAVIYGAITAYANQPGNEELKTQVEGVQNGADLFNLFKQIEGDEGLGNYMVNYEESAAQNQVVLSEGFANDMNGFFGAMDAINTVSPGLSNNLGTDDLWTNSEISGLLESLVK